MVKPGDKIGGFRIDAVENLPERHGVGITARHERTGFEVFHFLTDDKENFFGFVVSTPPEDDCGIPHILEHSVLSGSQTLPMKDAFFSMDKRSVATFMNAMTYPDVTLYPAASVVPVDYYNLLEYYGDSVFFPLLSENTFKTEGVRLEKDASGKPVFNGIVYNEMKGVYSQFDAAAEQAAVALLFPDNGYRFEYGGDPNAVPSLSYGRFLDFYRRHYVPQNVKLFLCGSLPTEEQLLFLEEKLLSRITVSGSRAVMPLQTRWERPRAFTVGAPPGEEGVTVAVSWLWDEAATAEACIEAELLSSCLCGHQGTPLYRKLIDCGYGTDLAPYMGGSSELRQLFFSCGLRGVKKRQAAAALEAVKKAVAEIAEEGIAAGVIDGILDSYEFSMREIKGGVPLGLRYAERMMFTWIRGGSPCEWFRTGTLFSEIRHRFRNPDYIKQLLRRLLTENPHRAEMTVVSSADYFKKWTRSADAAAASLTKSVYAEPGSLDRAIESFRTFQNEAENEAVLDRLPAVTRHDVEVPLSVIDFRVDDTDGFSVLETEARTNGIVYLDILFNMDSLCADDLPVVNSFAKLLLSAGQKNRPYDEVAREMTSVFGHISSFIEIGSEMRSRKPHLNLVIRTRFLAEKTDAAVEALRRMLSETVFTDRKRIRDALTESKNDMAADFTQSGTLYAAGLARSFLSTADAAAEAVDGFVQYRFLETVLKRSGGVARLARRFEALYPQICSKNRVLYALSCEPKARERIRTALPRLHEVLADTVPAEESSVFALPPQPFDLKKIYGVALPSDVAFNAWAKKADPFDSPHHSRQRVMAELLKTRVLDEVRVRSGAYGASASLKNDCFQMTSYRDPQLSSTFETFETVLKRFSENPPTEAEAENQIIRLLSDNLKPERPSGRLLKAVLRYLYGLDDGLRQKIFDETANVTVADVVREARRLIDSPEPAVRVSLAGRKALKKAKAAVSGFSLV